MSISFPIDLDSVEQSNLFLRALWASLRGKFGRLVWQYTPHRDGPRQRISLGFAQIGNSGSVQVLVGYRRAGCIATITFQSIQGNELFAEELTEAVSAARASFRNVHRMESTRVFSLSSSAIAFATYEAPDVRIRSVNAGFLEVSLGLDGFDQRDIDFQYQLRVGPILDLLACWTNCLVRRLPYSAPDIAAKLEITPPNELWMEDEEWMDGFPLIHHRVALSTNQLAALQAASSGELPLTDPLIGAARHFREGLELYETCREPGLQVSGDLVRTLFMSALEVISLRDAESAANCPQCGQSQHRISARVRELGMKHFGTFGKDLFAKEYQDRSGFLHAGDISGNYPVQPYSCPQLDPRSETGCATPTSQLDAFNLREFCSFVLRKECRSLFSQISNTDR